ncbi:DUF418 domain-containing protein [Novosphingobium sp.]|uniref:DUF418 domain-containing protein n=1 Tax=Novosphingobium sp. TaxID=1874826 RepID=UPI0026149592|nr:DUF418 domain-containing protein [Novosphingobium sp.]
MSEQSITAATTDHAVHLAPVRGRDRIAVLDVIRGVAILGIFFMNIPFMAGPIWNALSDPRTMGWSAADRLTWIVIETTWEGTQRGMLEFLFGAGLLVTAAKAMEPDGPVAVADLYIRRNLWLLLFGLFDIFCLLWPGDILHIYALCALALFPFRRLSVRWLIPLGLSFAAFALVFGAIQYHSRTQTQATYRVAVAKERAHQPLTKDEAAAVKEWRKIEDRVAGKDPEIQKEAKKEAEARASRSMADYAGWMIGAYLTILGKGELLGGVLEAFPAMLLGMALWKLGFIQGRRSTREYLIALILAWGFGMAARYIGAVERMAFMPQPKTIWMTGELARLAVSFGHIAAINLLVRGALSGRIIDVFRPAGQMAFTLYFMEQIAGLWIMFSPIGLDLPGGQGWAHLALQATVVIAVLLVFANVWMRVFASGPLEWLWRSLSYWERQPFRRVAPAAG